MVRGCDAKTRALNLDQSVAKFGKVAMVARKAAGRSTFVLHTTVLSLSFSFCIGNFPERCNGQPHSQAINATTWLVDFAVHLLLPGVHVP